MAIKFEITFSNKWLYSLITIGILLAFGVGVFAYNSVVSPSVMGHSASEVEGTISERIFVEEKACWQGGINSLNVSCPEGYKLLSCSSSSGDVGETNEGFTPLVFLAEEKCGIIVQNPYCGDSKGENEYQRVSAICYK